MFHPSENIRLERTPHPAHEIAMRRPTFTDDQIIRAGMALQREFPGRDVTINAIRLRMGGGKRERIKATWSKYLDELAEGALSPATMADLSPSAADAVFRALPGPLQDLVLGLARRLAEGGSLPERVAPASDADADGTGALLGQFAMRIAALEAELEKPRESRG